MNLMRIAGAGIALLSLANSGWTQDKPKKWKPYQFQGDERYEYKIVMNDQKGKPPKEIGYVLDIRKKGDDFEVTWSTKSGVSKKEMNQNNLFGAFGAGISPAWIIMNPMSQMFVDQLDLKVGEKMSFFGAATVKVTAEEKVGNRTGLTCQLIEKKKEEEVVTWEWTVDVELALPIKSVTYDQGKEKYRMELISYTKG
ncbi:MAG TPA: hypothetical protein VMU54_05585 [Planctomycetota bacterium]|nr:hypothetical protein [Planctomycetota bacterium]